MVGRLPRLRVDMSNVGFLDCFSERADDYARFRPHYPDALYDGVTAQVPGRERCWDCGTGNGQAARALARYFERVVATDGSADQLARAFPHPRIEYRCELAERTSLAPASVDLVTVAAALHWLDLPAFYSEVRRVVRPGGVLAAWTYTTSVEASPPVDEVVDHYARTVLAPYTKPQLKHVFTGYRELPFPFVEIPLEPVAIVVSWTLAELVGKLNTWSAAVAYRRQHGGRATDLVLPELTAAWRRNGEVDAARPVRLPLFARVGRV
jgi:SAM-dependent methyltransferase